MAEPTQPVTPKKTFAEKARAVMASNWFRPAALVVVTAIVTVEFHNKYLEWEARREIMNSPEWTGRNSDRDRSQASLTLTTACDMELAGDATPEILLTGYDRDHKPVMLAYSLKHEAPLWSLKQDSALSTLSCFEGTIVASSRAEKTDLINIYELTPKPRLVKAWPIEFSSPRPIIDEATRRIWIRSPDVKGFMVMEPSSGETERAPQGTSLSSSYCLVAWACGRAASDGEFELLSAFELKCSRANEENTLWSRTAPAGVSGDVGIIGSLAVAITGEDQISQTLEAVELATGKTAWRKPAFKLKHRITNHYVLTQHENSQTVTVLDPKTGQVLKDLSLPADWL